MRKSTWRKNTTNNSELGIENKRGRRIRNAYRNISQRQAAIIAGSAFIISFILVIVVGNFVLQNFLVPGDTEALANDIVANENLFNYAVIGYLIILTLDAIIAIAFYIVLRPTNEYVARLAAVFRMLYVAFMVISVLALAIGVIDAYGYGTIKLVGYLFFTVHISALGYLVLRSGYIPKVIGVLLLFASVSYVMAFYLNSIMPEALLPIFMLFMIMGELSLSSWLLVKGCKSPVTSRDWLISRENVAKPSKELKSI